jgi:hypothetical protein
MDQNYKSHRRLIPAYHFFIFLLVIALVIGSFVNLYESYKAGTGLYSASLICVIAIVMIFNFCFMRMFALRAHDRAIRAEENLRHFAMTGKLLHPHLTIGQIIALRFASDEEFPILANRAVAEKMKNDEIKRAITNWRPDHHRV